MGDKSNTVFIVDDNVMMRSMLKLGARDADLPVVGEAGTLQAALGGCMQLAPDIVLLDLGLPDGDGLDLLTDLKSRDPHVYVIVVTGKGDHSVVHSAVSLGAMGFILKPFSIGAITDALNLAKRKLATAKL